MEARASGRSAIPGDVPVVLAVGSRPGSLAGGCLELSGCEVDDARFSGEGVVVRWYFWLRWFWLDGVFSYRGS